MLGRCGMVVDDELGQRSRMRVGILGDLVAKVGSRIEPGALDVLHG